MHRDQKQDIIKGLGILTVINFHAVVTTTLTGTLKLGLSSSLMLIFFFLAGMNYTPGKRTLWENIKLRFKGVLLPFFQYLVLIMLVCGSLILMEGRMTLSEILLAVLKFLTHGLQSGDITTIEMSLIPAWFPVTMFLASVLFFACARFVCDSERRTWGCIIALSLVSAVLCAIDLDIPFWHIQTTPGLAAVMFLGLECKRKNVLSRIPTKATKSIAIFLLTALPAIVSYHFFSGANVISRGSWGTVGFWSLPLANIILVLNFLSYYSLAAITEKIPKLSNALVWVGQHSLTLLMIHFPILWMLGEILGWSAGAEAHTFSGMNYFRDIVLFILTLAVGFLWCAFTDWYKKKKRESVRH